MQPVALRNRSWGSGDRAGQSCRPVISRSAPCCPLPQLYDFLIAPFFARRGRPISLTLRIGIGYVIAALAMIAAGGEGSGRSRHLTSLLLV